MPSEVMVKALPPEEGIETTLKSFNIRGGTGEGTAPRRGD